MADSQPHPPARSQPAKTPAGPGPLSDSPLFWIYLFCTAGLIGMTLVSPRFHARQLAEERAFQGRQRAMQYRQGQEPSVELSTDENRVVTLQPLYVLFGVGLVIAWTLLWWQRRRAHRQANPGENGPRRPAP